MNFDISILWTMKLLSYKRIEMCVLAWEDAHVNREKTSMRTMRAV